MVASSLYRHYPAGQPLNNLGQGLCEPAGPVSDLPIPVVAPALDAAGLGQNTSVLAARGHGLDAGSQTLDLHRRAAVLVRAVAQLASQIISPAQDPACLGDGAGVPAPCAGLRHGPGHSGDVHGHGAVDRRPHAELPVAVAAPAVGRTVDQRAGVVIARIQRTSASRKPLHVLGLGVRCYRAVPQLPVVIEIPQTLRASLA